MRLDYRVRLCVEHLHNEFQLSGCGLSGKLAALKSDNLYDRSVMRGGGVYQFLDTHIGLS